MTPAIPMGRPVTLVAGIVIPPLGSCSDVCISELTGQRVAC